MARKKRGNQTVRFENRPYIIGRGNVVGEKEGEGPLAACFDETLTDDMYGEKSWEKAESKMLQTAMSRACMRAQLDKIVVCVQEKKTWGFPLQNSRSVSVFPTRRLPYSTMS